jgi:hypothetical protein
MLICPRSADDPNRQPASFCRPAETLANHNACLLSKYGRRSSRDQTSMLTKYSLEAKYQNRTTCHASLCSVVVTMGEQYAVLCTLGLKCLKPLQATLSILAQARVGDELPR